MLEGSREQRQRSRALEANDADLRFRHSSPRAISRNHDASSDMYRVSMSGQVASPSRVRAQVRAHDAGTALAHVAELLATAAGEDLTAGEIARGLAEREAVAPTNIGSGIAIPHFIDPRVNSACMVSITLERPIHWGSGQEPVDILFGLSGMPSEPWRHVRSLAHLARLAAIPGFADRLRSAHDDDSLLRIFAEEAALHG